MQAEFMRLSNELGFDISLQEDNMYRRCRRLICFDMDSTLIQTECIDELARRAGVGDKVSAITASAMRGEIDFKESFTRRVSLLKGLDASVMKDIAEHLPITEVVDRLMSALKRTGYKIAILSGGFTYFGNYMKAKYGIDYVYANELEIGPDGRLTRAGYQLTGRHPRNFMITPDGRLLLCACRDDNVIQLYSIDPATGLLTCLGRDLHVSKPVCIKLVP